MLVCEKEDTKELLNEELEHIINSTSGRRQIEAIRCLLARARSLPVRSHSLEAWCQHSILAEAFGSLMDNQETYSAVLGLRELEQYVPPGKSREPIRFMLARLVGCQCLAEKTGSHERIRQDFKEVREFCEAKDLDDWRLAVDHYQIKTHNMIGGDRQVLLLAEQSLAERQMLHEKGIDDDKVPGCDLICYIEGYIEAMALNGKVCEAQNALGRMLREHGQSPILWCLKGELHFKQEEFGQAVEAYDRALELQDWEEAWLGRALAQWFGGVEKQAVTDMHRAYRISGRLMRYALWLLALGEELSDEPDENMMDTVSGLIAACLRGELAEEELRRQASGRIDSAKFLWKIDTLLGLKAERAGNPAQALVYYRQGAESYLLTSNACLWARASLKKLGVLLGSLDY